MTSEKYYKCDNGVNFNAYMADIRKSEEMGVEMQTCICDYCDFENECDGVF